MTFLVNGASYTTGHGLAMPERDAWPVLFGKKLNSPVVNLSIDGASIDYVVYSTIKELSLHDYKKVIITWPALRRLLLIRRENSYLLHVAPMANHLSIGGYVYSDRSEFKQYLKIYYKNWYNALYDLKMSLQKIVLLQGYLKNRGCQYLFLNTNSFKLEQWLLLSTIDYKEKCQLIDHFDEYNDDQILAEETEIRSLYNQLDLKHYYDPVNFNLLIWAEKSNLRDPTTRHPTVEGQVCIADLVENLWQNLYGKNKGV